MGSISKEIRYLEKNWDKAILDYEVNTQGQITELYLYPEHYNWKDIHHGLSAVSKLTSLRKIEIGFSVSSLDPLRNLKELEWIQIEDGEIEDISPLKDLINLKHLELPSCHIVDISSLAGLKSLTHLILYDNKIEGISVIKNFPKLVDLNLAHNKIEDISVLSSVLQLQTLNLHNNQIVDVSPLSNLIELENLSLGYNKISNIDELATLGKLNHFGIESNYISNISLFERLGNLESLSCEKNQISKIEPIANLKKIRRINLASNLISDIGSLQNLQFVNWLNLAENPLKDITGLENLGELTSINLSYVNIKNFNALLKLPKLNQLWLDGNALDDADVAFIAWCPNLKSISLNHNAISDVTVFKQLKLERLSLRGNRIIDVFPLIRLQSLSYLNLEDNLLQLECYAIHVSQTESSFFNLWFDLANIYLKRDQLESAFACFLLLQTEEFRYNGTDAMRKNVYAHFGTQTKDDEPARLINLINQRALKLFNLGKDHSKSPSDLSLITLEILNYLDHPFKDILFRVLMFYAKTSSVNDDRLLKIQNYGLLVKNNDQIDELITQYEYKPNVKSYTATGKDLSHLDNSNGCSFLAFGFICLLLLFCYAIYLIIYGIINHRF